MKQNKTLNDFQIKSLLTHLNEFDILYTIPTINFSNELLYCFVFKYNDIAFTIEVLYSERIPEFKEPSFIEFVEICRKAITELLTFLDKVVFPPIDDNAKFHGSFTSLTEFAFSQYWDYRLLFGLDNNRNLKRSEALCEARDMVGKGLTPKETFIGLLKFLNVDSKKLTQQPLRDNCNA